MLDNHIIEESSSPRMAPAVFVRRTLPLCELSINTHPVTSIPCHYQTKFKPFGWLFHLIYKVDISRLRSTQQIRKKTAFCSGLGMGLFQFCRMPFGLTGAPGSFQYLMDSIFQGSSYFTIYLGDILIHSATEEAHQEHLTIVF